MTLYASWETDEEDDKEIPADEKEEPQKGYWIPGSINNIPPDGGDGDDGNNPPPPEPTESVDPDELEICVFEEEREVIEGDTEGERTEAFSWDKLIRRAAPILALVLLLLTGTLVVVFIIRDRHRKKAYFYDKSGEICAVAIHGNKVDITKAVAQASGKKLKVKVSEWYVNKAYGNELELCYNGNRIGTVAIEDNIFEISIS